MYRVWLPAECTSMCTEHAQFSIHSPDYVFTVLVSILMKTHNHFRAPSQRYKYVITAIYSKSDGVHYSRMRIANDTYHVPRTNVPTPPALCLGTPVPRQTRIKTIKNVMRCIGIPDQKKHRNKVGMIAYNSSQYNPTLRNYIYLSTINV